MESIHLEIYLPVFQRELFRAWLDSIDHRGFTGEAAQIVPHPGGAFTVGSGYITGTTLEMDRPNRILQSWRCTDFTDTDPDSLLELLFKSEDNGTRLILNHTNLPDRLKEELENGWKEYYFEPMQVYFQHRNR
jgi:activator of HSP90 ATPase